MNRLRIPHIASVMLAVAALLLCGPFAAPALAQDDGVGASAPAAPAAQFSVSGMAQVAVLQQEKETRTPAQQKMSSALLMALRRWRQDPIFDALPEFQTLAPDADGRILVDIDSVNAEDLKPLLERLNAMGAEIVYQSAERRTVRAHMPIDQTETLAGMPEVAFMRAADPAAVNDRAGPDRAWAEGALNRSEGIETHRADLVRQLYGITGAGQKICVLSDGVDSLAKAQAVGDLPPAVEILPGQAGSGDEGTAMLEIVHDLAPGARLGFATGFLGVASFAQNILGLRAAGCDIIVDDISYFIESPFQDNQIAQAVISVTNAGALFFSSSANDGNLASSRSGTWEGDFNPNGAIGGLPAGTVHNFGDGGKSNAFTSPAQTILLHWTDPFGASANDYDLYILNSTLSAVLGASTDIQNGSGTPHEIVQQDFPAGARVVVFRKNGAANRMISVLAVRSTLQLATDGATRGHSAAPLAFSVAAVPAREAFPGGGPAGPYPNPFTTADQVEWFSSDGPRRIFFGFDGALLPGAPAGNFSASGGVVRQKPDIAAADGVLTSIPGFDPFFGTSAAAPHAAAIAGLLKEAFPLSSTLEIRTLLELTALDIMAPGVDRNAGHGIVMPLAALQAGGAPLRAALTGAGMTGIELLGNGDAFVDPNETWQLTLPISSTGGVAAAAVSAALTSSTPGVTIPTATSAYPNLAPGTQGANVTPFVLQVPPEAACGIDIPLTLTLTYEDTAPRSMALPYLLSTGQVDSTPSVFSYTGAAVPIPDASTPPLAANVPIAVTGLPGRVGRLVFSIDGTLCTTVAGATTVGVDHPFASDLQFDLVAPGGTRVTVIDHAGEVGANFCQTILDDLAAAEIQAVTGDMAPFTGLFKPNQALAGFNTINGNGTWQLRVVDDSSGDTGTVRAFSLRIWPKLCQAASRLAGLEIGAGTLMPVFAPATRTYSAQLAADVLALRITPTASSGVTITVNGVVAPSGSPRDIPLGENEHPEITIDVASLSSTATNRYAVEVNRAPLAVDGTWRTLQGMPVMLNVMTATSDLDGDNLALVAVLPTTATHGTLTGASVSGQMTYTPAAGFVGIADFGFTVEDGHGGSSSATGHVVVGSTTQHLYLPEVLQQQDNSGRGAGAAPAANASP